MALGIGRFTQEDVIYNDGLNLYSYCNSNPVMYSDPSGYAGGSVKQKTCGSKESSSSSEGCNIPGRGYHKEVYANKPVKVTEAVDKWEDFLGPGEYTDIHPRTGLKDPDRIFSADGKRSIRFGPHEMNSKPSKFHYHEEVWTYDPINNVMNVDNTVVRMPYKN